MRNVLKAFRLLLADVAALGKQGNAALVGLLAGAVAAVVAAVLGVHLTVATVSGWLVLAAGVAGTLEKLVTVKAAAPPAK